MKLPHLTYPNEMGILPFPHIHPFSTPLGPALFSLFPSILYLARRKLWENSIGFMGMGCPRRPGSLQTHVASFFALRTWSDS